METKVKLYHNLHYILTESNDENWHVEWWNDFLLAFEFQQQTRKGIFTPIISIWSSSPLTHHFLWLPSWHHHPGLQPHHGIQFPAVIDHDDAHLHQHHWVRPCLLPHWVCCCQWQTAKGSLQCIIQSGKVIGHNLPSVQDLRHPKACRNENS